jgi:hypothetical protein
VSTSKTLHNTLKKKKMPTSYEQDVLIVMNNMPSRTPIRLMTPTPPQELLEMPSYIFGGFVKQMLDEETMVVYSFGNYQCIDKPYNCLVKAYYYDMTTLTENSTIDFCIKPTLEEAIQSSMTPPPSSYERIGCEETDYEDLYTPTTGLYHKFNSDGSVLKKMECEWPNVTTPQSVLFGPDVEVPSMTDYQIVTDKYGGNKQLKNSVENQMLQLENKQYDKVMREREEMRKKVLLRKEKQDAHENPHTLSYEKDRLTFLFTAGTFERMYNECAMCKRDIPSYGWVPCACKEH